MFFSKQNIAVAMSSTGASTHHTKSINGEIRSILYVSTFGSSALDITITTENTSQNVLVELSVGSTTAAAIARSPLQTAHTTTGGSTIPSVPVPVIDERLKCVFSDGAANATGTLTVIVSGNILDT